MALCTVLHRSLAAFRFFLVGCRRSVEECGCDMYSIVERHLTIGPILTFECRVVGVLHGFIKHPVPCIIEIAFDESIYMP